MKKQIRKWLLLPVIALLAFVATACTGKSNKTESNAGNSTATNPGGLMSDAGEIVSDVVEGGKDIVSDVIDGGKDIVSDIADGGRDIVTDIESGVDRMTDNARSR